MTCVAIVDDNSVSRKFMCDVFANRGWDTVALSTGDEVRDALLVAGTKRPDVVILDLHLPQHGAGITVLQTLKEHSKTRDVPVVMCSGDMWALQSLPESVLADVAAVLVKPFEVDQAYRCVEFALAHGAAGSTNVSEQKAREAECSPYDAVCRGRKVHD